MLRLHQWRLLAYQESYISITKSNVILNIKYFINKCTEEKIIKFTFFLYIFLIYNYFNVNVWVFFFSMTLKQSIMLSCLKPHNILLNSHCV